MESKTPDKPKTTKNIPDKLPKIVLTERQEKRALEWIAKQPAHEMDRTIEAMTRWELGAVDCGLVTWLRIVDRATQDSILLTETSEVILETSEATL